MNDTVFRTKSEPTPPQETPQMSEDRTANPGEVSVEPPFTEYEKEHGHPFLVDHYELGNMWNRTDMYSQAYVPEVETVNEYLQHIISRGDIGDTPEAVANELKKIEKMINVRKDQKKSVRIGMVAEYVKFLMKSENIKMESAKYGMI